MWLLDTSTLELRDFVGAGTPEYAILSHTWGEDEVTFRDMRKYREAAKSKAGYAKIMKSCEKARQDGHQYIWIDTCCIDKRSSAELSEAINSMWKWYQKSKVCYAYLCDVPSRGELNLGSADYDAFSKSRWFTRGWTLQELLGPKMIVFLYQDWSVIGLKAPPGTCEALGHEHQVIREQIEIFLQKVAEVTGIKVDVLRHPVRLERTAVATKMSWASKRQTTREEDLAYSLMGLFSVNMPVLYGEGLKGAFRRLQLEIIQKTTDQSIFVWRADREECGLLANSPRDFADSNLEFYPLFPPLHSYSMTNKGLLVNLPLTELSHGQHIVSLSYWVGIPNEIQNIEVKMVKLHLHQIDGGVSLYRRNCKTLDLAEYFAVEGDREAERKEIYVLQDEHFEEFSVNSLLSVLVRGNC